jgi:hypothetical protein
MIEFRESTALVAGERSEGSTRVMLFSKSMYAGRTAGAANAEGENMVRDDEMACISRKKANCTAEINESKAKIKGAVERNGRLIRLIIGMRITGVVVVPQDVCAMNILRA